MEKGEHRALSLRGSSRFFYLACRQLGLVLWFGAVSFFGCVGAA